MAFSARPLHEAAYRKNRQQISKLVEQGHNPNECDTTGRTPLYYLIGYRSRRNDHTGIGPQPQPRPDLSHLQLDEAAQEERMRCIQVLLSSGADGNVQDARGWSLIHQGAWDGDLEAVKYLATRGVPLDRRNSSNQTPLDLAVIKHNKEIIKFLDNVSNLQTRCRQAIQTAMGSRRYKQINDLPLPKRLKLFVNFDNPYEGWTAKYIPNSPWNDTELTTKVPAHKIHRFLATHATKQHLIKFKVAKRPQNGWESERDELVTAFKDMFISKSFRDVEYEEQPWKFRDYKKKINYESTVAIDDVTQTDESD